MTDEGDMFFYKYKAFRAKVGTRGGVAEWGSIAFINITQYIFVKLKKSRSEKIRELRRANRIIKRDSAR